MSTWHDKSGHRKPSLADFKTYATVRALADPNSCYNYQFSDTCAVGQYLTSIGSYRRDWVQMRDPLLRQLNFIAFGPGTLRDQRGRFVSPDDYRKVATWTWTALAKRLEAATAHSHGFRKAAPPQCVTLELA